MKRFIKKLQSLSDKADQLGQAMQRVPPKVAGVREAVALTATQLQQLRSQVQASLMGLKTDGDDQLLDALREISDNASIFKQAGFDLGGVDVEIEPTRRLIVHLERRDDVHQTVLRSLRDAAQSQRTTHALLEALVRAESMANEVHLTDLQYRSLILHIGPTPTVRLCWRTERKRQGFTGLTPTTKPETNEETSPEQSEQKSFFGPPAGLEQGEPPQRPDPHATSQEGASLSPAQSGKASSKEQAGAHSPTGDDEPAGDAANAATETEKELPPSEATLPTQVSTSPTPRTRSTTGKTSRPAWNSDALQRFKTMPNVSKYR